MTHGGYLTHNEIAMMGKSKCLLASGLITDPVEALRHLCLSRGFTGILHFGRVFREMEIKGKTVLNMEEFLEALHKTGLELPQGEAEKVFYHFDVDGTGGIHISNLLEGVKVS